MFGACCIPAAHAQTSHYQIGQLTFQEQGNKLTITPPHSQPLQVELLGGGGEWPLVLFEENGRVNIGSRIFDSTSGRIIGTVQPARTINLTRGLTVRPMPSGFLLKRNGHRCLFSRASLKLSNAMSPFDYLISRFVQIVPSDTGVLIRTRQDLNDADKPAHEYAIAKIDMRHCSVSAHHSLGDPDYLNELGWTRQGGWWLTGSIEQTLLRSTDGLHWSAVPLDRAISSLISSYIVDKNEIWLAAIMADHAHPGSELFELVHSSDAGKSWTGVRPGDELLRSIPPFWLEGARRRATAPLPDQKPSL
jgi:hypothetical protein